MTDIAVSLALALVSPALALVRTMTDTAVSHSPKKSLREDTE